MSTGATWARGKRVVVTAGGTREPLDPVRYLSNRSSGKMGHALAVAAADAGAGAVLITTAGPIPDERITVVTVETADEMLRAVMRVLDDANVLIMAAAVADYRPQTVAMKKIKKTGAPLTITLEPTTDILQAVASHPRRSRMTIVGFAAETDDHEAGARRKLADKRLDYIVVNDVSRPDIGMGAADNEVTVFAKDGGATHFERAPKPHIAQQLIAFLAASERG